MSLFYKHIVVNQKDQHESVFYYWWLFLKEVGNYGADHDLYEDFGDLGDNFVEWMWKRGDYLFAPTRKDEPILIVEDTEQAQNCLDQGHLVLSVNRNASKRDLKRLFDIIILLEIKTPRGRQKHFKEADVARYEVHQRPDLKALDVLYRCRIYKKKNPKAKLYQIAEALDLLDDENKLTGDKYDDAIIKPSVNALMSRRFKKIDKLIKNVAKGKFPCYD